MELEFFEEAAAEVEEDRSWYRKRSEPAEAGFLRDHAITQVVDAPAQYFVENDIIRVVAVAHDNKRPGYWRKRLRNGR